jgi:hypothetical protein
MSPRLAASVAKVISQTPYHPSAPPGATRQMPRHLAVAHREDTVAAVYEEHGRSP